MAYALGEKYKLCIKNKRFVYNFILSLIFLFIGIVATFYAIIYATDRASNPVSDIILSNIPVFDVDGIFLYGPVVFWVIIGIYLVFYEPRKIPFTLKSIALFTLIRAVSITLTHIGPFPTGVKIDLNSIIGVFTTGSDLFFSSHTGLPFLMALVFWHNKTLRIFCIASSIFFGMIVLMAHVHYSIDVFAAFFITYTIFKISEKIFKYDRHVFMMGLDHQNKNA